MGKPTQVSGLSPETRLKEASRQLLAARLADVRAQEQRVKAGLAPEAIHDMRVATRRLRAALRLFGGEELEPLSRRVKQLQDALGGVRDLQVQVDWFAKSARRASLTRGANLVVEREEQRLPAHSERLQKALSRWQGSVAPNLEKTIGNEAPEIVTRGRLGGPRMRKRLLRDLKRIQKRLVQAATIDADDAHTLRIAVKKFRYQAELLEVGFPGVVTPMLALLVPMQELLGALHDADVRLELLRDALPEERPAVELLRARVSAERARHASKLAVELSRWKRERITRSLRRMLQDD